MTAAFGSGADGSRIARIGRSLLAVLLLAGPASLAAQDATPHTRTISYMGVALELTVWDADSARARQALDSGQAVALRADTVLPPDHAQMDSTKRRLRLARKESVQELREIAQAGGIDAAAAAMQRAGAVAGSAEIAGNVLFFGRPPLGDAWGVLLQHPAHAEKVSAMVPLDEGAVATAARSGSGARDKAGTIGVTVIAPSALTARVFARALLDSGPAAGCAVAAREPAVHAIWFQQDPGAADTRIVLTPDLASRIRFSADDSAVQTAACSQAARQ